jgi:hypothetical protein
VQKQQKREKERNKKRNKISLMFFPPPSPKKRKKCGHRKCRPKGKEVTKGRRTKDGQISHLSLSLSCRVRIYSQFFFQEEKKTQNHPSEEGAENPPSFAFLSVFALSRWWWCCFIRAREHAEESEHPPKRKKNKQTNKGRRHKKPQKSANVAFFSEQSAADF